MGVTEIVDGSPRDDENMTFILVNYLVHSLFALNFLNVNGDF